MSCWPLLALGNKVPFERNLSFVEILLQKEISFVVVGENADLVAFWIPGVRKVILLVSSASRADSTGILVLRFRNIWPRLRQQGGGTRWLGRDGMETWA